MEGLCERKGLFDFMINKGNGVTGLSQLNLDRIPAEFIQLPQHRLHHQNNTQTAIPIIDVSHWGPKVSASICAAAANWGFFQIINHGIPTEVLHSVKSAAHDFFALSVEERSKYLEHNSPTPTVTLRTSFSPFAEKVLEWKDSLFHVAHRRNQGSQLWPPVSRDRVVEYINLARPVIRKLLEVLLKGINVDQMDEAKEGALMESLSLNLIHYPKCPNPELATGASAHTDISSLTLLLQDDVGGLYVRASDEGWVHVEPIEGSIIVNIGDVLRIMSNDKYKSVEHRVFLVSNKSRVSVPIFANASQNAVIGPLPEALGLGEKPIYRDLLFSDYFNHFFTKDVNDGNQTIDYARI